MIYRVAIRSTILLAGMVFTIPTYAAAEKAGVLKGTCSSGILTSHPVNYGTLSESAKRLRVRRLLAFTAAPGD